MSKTKRIATLAIAILMLTGAFTACSSPDTSYLYYNGEYTEGGIVELIIDDDVPLAASPFMFNIPMPATGNQVRRNDKAEIDFSNARDGYVMVRFLPNTTKVIRATVRGPSGVQYQYGVNRDKNWEVLPLSDGNGKYTITVHEQTEGNRFATANTATIDVTLRDEFAPFLRPNQFVNFNRDSAVVRKAAELTRGTNNLTGRVSAIYNFVIGNITYDRNFAAEVQRGMHAGYVPDVDAVLASGKRHLL
jgi:hypothetical protein